MEKSGDLFNRFLGLFGLMKVKAAKNLSTTLHLHYVKCVLNGVKKDFDVEPVTNIISYDKKWWETEFTKMVNRGYDELNIITPPKFKESKGENK